MTKTNATAPATDLAAPHTMRDAAARVLAEKAAKLSPEETLPTPPDHLLPGDGQEWVADMKAKAKGVAGELDETTALAGAAESWESAAQQEQETVALSLQNAIVNSSFEPEPGTVAKATIGQPRGAVVLPMGRIRGRVTGTETIETQFGSRMAVVGNFTALATMRNNEMIQAERLYLSPQSFAQTMAGMLRSMSYVDVDLDVGAVSSGRPMISYNWTCTLFVTHAQAVQVNPLLQPRRVRGAVKPAVLTDDSAPSAA